MPINECALGLDNCDFHAVCTDTATSFECTCQSGYSGDGRICTGKINFGMYICMDKSEVLHDQVDVHIYQHSNLMADFLLDTKSIANSLNW